jgi:ASC-1-like (ASCH) protein
MMRFVGAPQKLAGMLQAVKQVDIQIVCNQEKQYLRGNRKIFKKLKTLPCQVVLQRVNNIIEYDYFEEITLDNGVPNQINPKALPKEGKAFSVWRYTLPCYDENHPAY